MASRCSPSNGEDPTTGDVAFGGRSTRAVRSRTGGSTGPPVSRKRLRARAISWASACSPHWLASQSKGNVSPAVWCGALLSFICNGRSFASPRASQI